MKKQRPFCQDVNQIPLHPGRLCIAALAPLLCLLSACGGSPPEPITTGASSSGDSAVSSAISITSRAALSTRNAGHVSALAGAGSAGQRGVMLAGLPGENAYEALEFYAVVDREIRPVGRPSAAPIASGPLKATLDLAATVGQVNAALTAVGGRIVGMQPRQKTVVIELTPAANGVLPNPQAAASLLASRAFQKVQGPGLPVEPDVIKAAPKLSDPVDPDQPWSS